jgi:endogenous inhibitor of DNA gyrase (YacG/DUF329 family)
MADLWQWLSGEYRIPASPDTADDGEASVEGTDEEQEERG